MVVRDETFLFSKSACRCACECPEPWHAPRPRAYTLPRERPRFPETIYLFGIPLEGRRERWTGENGSTKVREE